MPRPYDKPVHMSKFPTVLAEQLHISCEKCNYSTIMDFPMINALGSLQIYHFPNFLANELKNAKKDSYINLQQLAFFKCTFRYDCFQCLSTLTFMMSDLPLTGNRIKILVNKKHHVPTAKFKNIMDTKHQVLNFALKRKMVIKPTDLVAFDKNAKKAIDLGGNFASRIAPVKLLTRSVISALCKDRRPPPEIVYQKVGKKYYNEILHISMLPKAESSGKNPCRDRGHKIFLEKTDKMRSCERCNVVFQHDKYAQVQKIRKHADPFLHSCVLFM